MPTFAADVYSLGSLFLFVLTDGQSNLNDLESLGNLEDTTNETNEVNKCVNDIRTIKRMTTDDPKSRPDTSELLTFAMLDQQWDENGLQETDAFSHTAEPLLLRFIQQIKHGNEGRNRGHSSAKSKQPSTGKTLEEEYKHKIEQIYQFLENVKQLDLEQLRQHGRLEKLKYADLCSFAQLTETAAANQILKHDESKVLHSMQNDLQAATDVDLNNRESCNSCCERESHDHESSVTPFVSNVLPCVHAEQMEKVNQFMKELMELRKQKAKISFGLFELVKSAEFYIIDHVLNTFAAPLIIEIFDDNKLSLLHMAVKYHSFNVVENLVNGRGFANVLHEPRFQKTLIHHCIEDIHTVDEDTFEQKRMMLEFLFAKDPLLIQSENNIKHTPLHIATDRVFSNGKQIDFIKMLLDAKACVNAKDEHGRTPLHLAVKDKVSENVNDILQILVDHGADPDAQDIINETFLHNAAKFVPPPAFHKIVNYLVSIEKTRSFHTPDKNGWTVLHHAASNMNGHPLDETLQLFKTHGVDFNALSNDGNSVMFRAIEFRRSEAFLRTLNQLGADWKLENHSRDTALHIAAHSDYLTAVKLLIGLGFDANQKNFDGNTPLHRAIDCCYFNYYNDTELKPSYDVVHELVINGADPNLKNNKGQSTVDIANDKFKEKKIGQDILNVLVNTHSIKTNF
ncbi:unnamed protein product [Orchesella dallaii]|uniref:Uncharacterized protein n=1 Tax=Orchesella dallaii TaxID=48710 RepID=A0ABP1RQJ4_9HEXA